METYPQYVERNLTKKITATAEQMAEAEPFVMVGVNMAKQGCNYPQCLKATLSAAKNAGRSFLVKGF